MCGGVWALRGLPASTGFGCSSMSVYIAGYVCECAGPSGVTHVCIHLPVCAWRGVTVTHTCVFLCLFVECVCVNIQVCTLGVCMYGQICMPGHECVSWAVCVSVCPAVCVGVSMLAGVLACVLADGVWVGVGTFLSLEPARPRRGHWPQPPPSCSGSRRPEGGQGLLRRF